MVMVTACPNRQDLKKAYNASKQISKYGRQATTAVGDLFEAKIIDFRTKEQIVARLRYIQQKGDDFIGLLDAARAEFGNKLPDEQIRALDLFFNAEIVRALTQIFADMARLSKEKSDQVYMAILILKNAVFFIADIFNQATGDSVSYKTTREFEYFHNLYNGGRLTYAE